MRIRIPNSFLTDFEDRTAFRLAVAFYSLINPTTGISKDNSCYIITVKQATLARISGLSVATVKRTLPKLVENGFISFKIRTHKANGELGTTLYYVRKNASDSAYFCVQRKALMQIGSSKAFYLYCLCCKLANTACKSLARTFFHSYSDLADMVLECGISASRADVIGTIKELVEEYKLLQRERIKCKCGDYTDNKYTVAVFITGKIRKRGIKKKCVCACNTYTPKTSYSYISTSQTYSTISINPFGGNVKRHSKNNLYFFGSRGSPKNELWISDPLKSNICQKIRK